MKSTLIVSAVQQPCNDDRQTNLDFSIAKIHEAAAANADLVVLPELHLGPYFCQNEDYNHFDLAQAIPGPTTEILSAIARKLKIVIVSTIFEKERQGFITIPPWFLTRMAVLPANTEKCTYPMIRVFMKNITSPQATWVLNR